MTATTLRWKKIRSGLYRATHNGHAYEVERFGHEDNGSGVIWHSRIDGESFDAGNTMAEAKGWCEAAANDQE